MKVEAVTVCVGYGDFLAAVLPENLPLIDNLVVVTASDDAETIRVCRRHSVHCVTTDDHKRNGAFNKYRLVQRGLDQIGGKDWVLLLDADIVLPRKFRDMLKWAHLDAHCIYGADRQQVTSWEEWQAIKKYVGGWDNHQHGCGHWCHPKYPMMSRWVSHLHGYVPVGYFQLWHSTASVQEGYHHRRFPQEHGDAARCDVQFALQWDRRERQLLPEVICLHLESETAPLGANWQGRKTRRFGPALPPVKGPLHVS